MTRSFLYAQNAPDDTRHQCGSILWLDDGSERGITSTLITKAVWPKYWIGTPGDQSDLKLVTDVRHTLVPPESGPYVVRVETES